MRNLLIKSLETSRSLSAELSPPVLYRHGLADALNWLARWMEKTHKLQVALQVDLQAEPAQHQLKILLFESARELLFNVVKHSGTHSARIDLTRHNEKLVIAVCDDGKGFDTADVWQNGPKEKGGFGLFNIRERLQLLGGTFEIGRAAFGGTLAILSAPLQTALFGPPEQHPAREESANAPQASPQRPTLVPSQPPGDKIRVLLADDHAVMRKGLSLICGPSGYLSALSTTARGTCFHKANVSSSLSTFG